MAAVKYNFKKHKQGTDVKLTLTLRDKTTKALEDITGSTFFMDVKETADSPSKIFELKSTDVSGDRIVVDEGASTIVALIPGSLTADVCPRTYVYDLFEVQASGFVRELLYGNLPITDAVTEVS